METSHPVILALKELFEIVDVFLCGDTVGKAVEKTRKEPDVLRTCGFRKDILFMRWNRSNTVGLASSACSCCQGGGQRLVYKNYYAPCSCVFRSVFRACLNRFRECVESGGISGTVTWEFCP